MKTIVCKFGGSSLADAEHFKKVAAIAAEDPARCYIVASAPGKRSSSDTKVTDMLYQCYESAVSGEDYTSVLSKIRDRFNDIAKELNVLFPIEQEIDAIDSHLRGTPSRDYMASRGEYLNSRLLAAYLGYQFIDAADIIVFRGDGHLDVESTNLKTARALKNISKAVIPGFYGMTAGGVIKTFTRGGSDVTGSVVARAVAADLYENWTDVSGMMVADPRIVDSPKTIEFISYRELRELSYMGASVLHEEAVFPVRESGIPINVRNTNCPEDPGTIITAEIPENTAVSPITGIAGKKGFSSIQIEKVMMNSEVGFGRRVLEVLERYDVSFEHLPSGIDTVSVVVETEHLNMHRDDIIRELCRAVNPDSISIEDGLAMVAVVGRGMVSSKGTAARIFSAIAQRNINIRMLDQGSSELNIILGISESDYESAICSIYDEFMK